MIDFHFQGPVITNLPRSFSIREDRTAGFLLMTVAASDTEGGPHNWVIGVTPFDGGAFSIGAASE